MVGLGGGEGIVLLVACQGGGEETSGKEIELSRASLPTTISPAH